MDRIPDNVKAQNKKKFSLKEDGKSYKLKLMLTNNMIIIGLVSIQTLQKYQAKLEMKDLNDINKVFTLIEGIEDSYQYMISIIEQKHYTLRIQDQTAMILIQEQNQNLEFNLEIQLLQKPTNNQKIISKMYQSTLNLTKKQEYLDKSNEQLQEQLIKLKLKFNSMQQSNQIKNKPQQPQNYFNKTKLLLIVILIIIPAGLSIYLNHKDLTEIVQTNTSKISNILQNNEWPLIKNWINENNKYFNTQIKFTLLYKITNQNINLQEFFQNCTNQGPTLILIKTKQYEQRIGGFTRLQWDQNKTCIKSQDPSFSLIFSLEERKMFGNSKRIIPCQLSISENQIAFASDLIIKQANQSIFNLNYFCERDCETIVEKKFEIGELEVYKVDF